MPPCDNVKKHEVGDLKPTSYFVTVTRRGKSKDTSRCLHGVLTTILDVAVLKTLGRCVATKPASWFFGRKRHAAATLSTLDQHTPQIEICFCMIQNTCQFFFNLVGVLKSASYPPPPP